MTDFYAEVGGHSTIIKDFESSGRMQIEFSRNVESFALNHYSETRPVVNAEGYYLRINPDQGGRILYDDDREHAWPDLADRPTGTDNQLSFIMATYKTFRKAYNVPLSDRAVGMTAWPVAEVELRQKGQQAMTARTQKAISVLSAGLTGNQTAAASSFSGVTGSGYWGSGTVAVPNIQICLQGAMNTILQATVGVLDPEDLILIVNPYDAMRMSQSAEIRGMLSNSVYSYPQVTGQLPGFRGKQRNYGLPPMLYDFRVAVEKTVRVGLPKGTANTTTGYYSYAIPNGTAFLVTRKDNEQVNPVFIKAEGEGRTVSDEVGRKIPVYSTLCGFFKEELTTEIIPDQKNRRTLVSVVTDFDYQVSSPLTGFKFTSTFAS